MKVILVLLAFYVLWWLLRRSLASRRQPPPPAAQPPQPQPVLACAYCGVHLPKDDMLAGAGGVFCGEAHRVAFDETGRGR